MRNLSLLLDFDDQFHRDQQQDGDFLHRRDRRLAVEQGIDGSRGSLPAWLSAVRGQPLTSPHGDPRLRTWRWLRVLFVLAGCVLGAAAMLGLLYYDGGRRINVTLIIGVALLQLLLALLTCAEAWVGWQPWRGLLGDAASRWLPAPAQPQPLLRALAAPLAARVAQGGGLAFGVAALLTLLAQVLVHDLAFGWSTTLQASAPAYHEFTTALAWPWRGWLPGAVPSLPLVEQSRYFRVGSAAVANPELLGIWWRFLAMLWLCYVVVPRCVLLVLARVQLAMRVRRLLDEHPGGAPLRERCSQPVVESGGGDHGAMPMAVDGARPPPARPGRVLVHWAGAGDPGLAARWLATDARSLQAGGSASLEQDHETLEQARAAGGPLVVVAHGWEPPTGELGDFLERAHAVLGNVPVQLLPLATGDTPALVDEPVLAQWQRFVARLRQPSITLVDVPQEEHAP